MVDRQEHIIIHLAITDRDPQRERECVCELTMYHWSTSSPSPCYRSSSSSNIGNTSDQPDATFLPSAFMSLSSYGDVLQEQHYCSSQSQVQQQVPFRRVVSTCDLVGAAAPVGRYNAEERRERIEKYRSKRNQRNFQKKITYACRKTLADSRPRVKGRFARNDGAAAADAADTEFTTDHQLPNPLMNEASSSSSSSSMPEWWPAMQQADTLAREDEQLLAAYHAVSSINLY